MPPPPPPPLPPSAAATVAYTASTATGIDASTDATASDFMATAIATAIEPAGAARAAMATASRAVAMDAAATGSIKAAMPSAAKKTSNLQLTLTCVPLIKALQLVLSYLFWYSCFNLQICSLWMSFGVYVTGVLFQTASFVSFLLISHGYCIVCERLSVSERCTTAALGGALYLTLVGYKAAVPYFTVLLLLSYSVSFYVIFHNISQNLLVLRSQLSSTEEEDIELMHDALHTKYTMLKKFQGAMQIVAIAEIVIHTNMDSLADNYWLRLLIQEWAQFCIFFYIGWIFRSQEVSLQFSVMPNMKAKGGRTVPPIYSVEMSEKDYEYLTLNRWNIGVPSSFPSSSTENSTSPLLIIVQQPRAIQEA